MKIVRKTLLILAVLQCTARIKRVFLTIFMELTKVCGFFLFYSDARDTELHIICTYSVRESDQIDSKYAESRAAASK